MCFRITVFQKWVPGSSNVVQTGPSGKSEKREIIYCVVVVPGSSVLFRLVLRSSRKSEKQWEKGDNSLCVGGSWFICVVQTGPGTKPEKGELTVV